MDTDVLKKSILFRGMTEEEIAAAQNRLSCRRASFAKEEIVCRAGEEVSEVGVVLSGSVRMESVDLAGNCTILGLSQQGDLFAEAYACVPGQPLLVDVTATGPTEILFVSIPALLTDAAKNPVSARMVQNLLRVTARKNLNLSMRIFHSSPKTIRARVLSYLSEQVRIAGSSSVTIPLNRQQLADYLGVERTALSKELGKMQKDGLIRCRKNQFEVLISPEE